MVVVVQHISMNDPAGDVVLMSGYKRDRNGGVKTHFGNHAVKLDDLVSWYSEKYPNRIERFWESGVVDGEMVHNGDGSYFNAWGFIDHGISDIQAAEYLRERGFG